MHVMGVIKTLLGWFVFLSRGGRLNGVKCEQYCTGKTNEFPLLCLSWVKVEKVFFGSQNMT